jgi:hypothetical protein
VTTATLDLEDRPILPLVLVTILLGEVAILSTLVAMFGAHPPYTYEAGWAGAGSMIVMPLYSVRRRIPALRNLGSLRAWLDAHIFLGFQGFVLAAYHSVGISRHASLAALNFAIVAVVVFTGVIGRYLYGFIPRARSGYALAYAELARGAQLPPRRECRGVFDLIALDLERRAALRRLARDPALSPARLDALRRSIRIASWMSALEVADRWFSRWTLVHRPLAILLIGTTALHVLAHFAYAT